MMYVGPYLVISKNSLFELESWKHLVYNARSDLTNWFLVPRDNKLYDVERCMIPDQVEGFTFSTISHERAAFSSMTFDLLRWCAKADIDVKERWGVIP